MGFQRQIESVKGENGRSPNDELPKVVGHIRNITDLMSQCGRSVKINHKDMADSCSSSFEPSSQVQDRQLLIQQSTSRTAHFQESQARRLNILLL